MTKIERLFPAFGAIFAVIYAFVLYYDSPLVSYHTKTGVWTWGKTLSSEGGPSIFWYGLVLTALLFAVPVTAAIAFIPENVSSRLWSGLTWLLPLGAMASFVWLLLPYYTK
jgi:hypothetical protein